MIYRYEKVLEAGKNPVEEEEVDERLGALMSSITFVVFAYVRRGLLEAHKLIVVTQLTMKILLKEGALSESEVTVPDLAAGLLYAP